MIDAQIHKYNLLSCFCHLCVYDYFGADHSVLDNQLEVHPWERLILTFSVVINCLQFLSRGGVAVIFFSFSH